MIFDILLIQCSIVDAHPHCAIFFTRTIDEVGELLELGLMCPMSRSSFIFFVLFMSPRMVIGSRNDGLSALFQLNDMLQAPFDGLLRGM